WPRAGGAERMRKDYLAVSADDARADESAFLDRFWTSQWDGRAARPAAAAVTRRNEYRIIRPLLDTLPAGSRVLDGGCGLGEWTVFLTDRGARVTGLDISQRTVARLKALLPD